MAQQDWKAALASRFDALATSAAEKPLPKELGKGSVLPADGYRGVIDDQGREVIQHHIVTPQPCEHCKQITSESHESKDACIASLRKALEFAQGNIQVIR